MVDWSIVASGVTASATAALAIFSWRLWKVNDRLTAIQDSAEKRNDAILQASQVGLTSTNDGPDRAVVFRLWNSGLKDTQIRACYLRWSGEGGREERARLDFQIARRSSRTDSVSGSGSAPEEPYGEWLRSGEMWEVTATPQARDRHVRAFSEPRIVIAPVLGHLCRLDIEDPLVNALEEGLRRLEDEA